MKTREKNGDERRKKRIARENDTGALRSKNNNSITIVKYLVLGSYQPPSEEDCSIL